MSLKSTFYISYALQLYFSNFKIFLIQHLHNLNHKILQKVVESIIYNSNNFFITIYT